MFRLIYRIFFRRPAHRRSTMPFERNVKTGSDGPWAPQPEKHPTRPHGLSHPAQLKTITGKCYVIDGDTIQIGKMRLRLAGIDAPELEHPWGQNAKWELVRICKGQEISAVLEPELSYDRIVATCYLPDGRDLSAEMVKAGLALDWPKFSGGKYSHLEIKDARKKHWKAAARQRGHMAVFNK